MSWGKAGGFAPISALKLAASPSSLRPFVKDIREHLPRYRDLGHWEHWCTLVGFGGPAARRMVSELHLPKVLGNVIFLERPLNAVSLTSAIGTTLRARRRQRQGRDHMAERAASPETLRQLNETLETRVAGRTEALRASEAALAQSQKMEAVGRLTGGIAHDFNNLLAAVVGNLELLQLRVASDERALQLAGAAFQAATRGAKLTTQLLAFSRTQKLALG